MMMKIRRNAVNIVLVFILICISCTGLVLGGCSTHELKHYDLYMQSEWLIEPDTLEFCNTNLVNPDRILEQMDWWFELNPAYTYYNVVYDADCNNLPNWGVIRFDRSDIKYLMQADAAAYSERQMESLVYQDPPDSGRYFNESYMTGCTVRIRKFNTKWTIRHEIGHCWGWGHVPENQQGHVMSTVSGQSTYGLENYP
jgi:hypothetical protein